MRCLTLALSVLYLINANKYLYGRAYVYICLEELVLFENFSNFIAHLFIYK